MEVGDDTDYELSDDEYRQLSDTESEEDFDDSYNDKDYEPDVTRGSRGSNLNETSCSVSDGDASVEEEEEETFGHEAAVKKGVSSVT